MALLYSQPSIDGVRQAVRPPAPRPAAPVVPAAVPVVQPQAAVDPNLQYIQTLIDMLGGSQYQAPAPPPIPKVPEMPLVAPDLGPEDIAYFDSLMSRANQVYNQESDNNLYQQGIVQSEHGITQRDLQDRLKKTREQLPGQYQRRGLMNSGVYQQGLTDYATVATNATSDLERRFQNQMGGLQNAYKQLGETHGMTTSDIEARRTARRNTIASTLRAVR
jgi:hypothetical protein